MSRYIYNHSVISWRNAISKQKLIEDGLIDLIARKEFVLSLHNSIELIMKQILLDQNNTLVFIRNNRFCNKEAIFKRNFIKKHKLNNYLEENQDVSNNLRTIGFNKLINIIFKTTDIKKYISKNSIRSLNKLRNPSMHFKIDETDFLSFDELKKFSLLMENFCNFLMGNNYFETNDIGEVEFKTTSNLTQLNQYRELVRTSMTNKSILMELPYYNADLEIPGISIKKHDHNDLLGISNILFNLEETLNYIEINVKISKNEFDRRFIQLYKLGLITILDLHDLTFIGRKFP